jgi:endonuclease-8
VPEGDVVWRAGRRLDQSLAGKTLAQTDFRVPELATVDLTGRTVREVVSVGKHLLFRTDGGLTLRTHFRMDGSWHLTKPGAPRTGGPDHDIRIVLGTADIEAVGYRLHDIALVATRDEQQLIGHLGPDLLAADWGPEACGEAVRRLLQPPDRTIAAALLDQRVVAGIGTVYRAETLFLSGVDPWTPVVDVRRPDQVLERAHRLLHANRDRVPQVTTGDTRRGHELWVYGRAGRPCRRCGTTLRRVEIGDHPYERVLVWCPHCQAGPGND